MKQRAGLKEEMIQITKKIQMKETGYSQEINISAG